jgi:hypothetical protein
MQHAYVEFTGMNPEKMQSLIDDLKTAQHTITGFAGEFSAPLAAQGISTATIHQAAHWTADQVSDLSERLRELRDQERTTPAMPGGPTPTLPGGTMPTVPGGTVPAGVNPGGPATGTPAGVNPGGPATGTPHGVNPGGPATGTPHGVNPGGQHGTVPAGVNPGGPATGSPHPAGPGQPSQHGTTPGGAAGGSQGGASGAAGPGAATAGGFAGGGGSTGAATPYVPGPPSAHAAAAHTSAAHATTAAHRGAQTAGHVTRAAQHGQSLPDRVWHDIERYASEPQFAAAFVAAIGAAGLTALVASIAESRKKDKQAKEAARRQAMLDELTRSAGEHEGRAEPVPSPGQRAARSLARPPFGDAPGLSQAQEPGGHQKPDAQPEPDGPEADLQPQNAPKLSLVMATGPEEVPAARVPPPSEEN